MALSPTERAQPVAQPSVVLKDSPANKKLIVDLRTALKGTTLDAAGAKAVAIVIAIFTAGISAIVDLVINCTNKAMLQERVDLFKENLDILRDAVAQVTRDFIVKFSRLATDFLYQHQNHFILSAQEKTTHNIPAEFELSQVTNVSGSRLDTLGQAVLDDKTSRFEALNVQMDAIAHARTAILDKAVLAIEAGVDKANAVLQTRLAISAESA